MVKQGREKFDRSHREAEASPDTKSGERGGQFSGECSAKIFFRETITKLTKVEARTLEGRTLSGEGEVRVVAEQEGERGKTSLAAARG